MLGSRADLHDEITSRDGNDLGDDEYVDYSVASDIGDEDSDTFDANNDSNDNTDDDLDWTDMQPNVDNRGCDPSRLPGEPEGTLPQEELQGEPTVVHFPGRRAGEVYSKGIMTMEECENALGGPSENPYSPFASKIDWELAKWAKLRGPSATSFTEMLNISGVSGPQLVRLHHLTPLVQLHEQLNLSYMSSNGLNKKIDTLPKLCPKFHREEVTVDGETFEIFYRNTLDCVAEIFGRHDFAPYLKFKPERHYVDADMTLRIYSDMHTGKWWWEVQVSTVRY